MQRRMPRPEEVSHHHIDSTIMAFLRGEQDLEWTELSLTTLHPRDEIRLYMKESVERYRTFNEKLFLVLVVRLGFLGLAR